MRADRIGINENFTCLPKPKPNYFTEIKLETQFGDCGQYQTCKVPTWKADRAALARYVKLQQNCNALLKKPTRQFLIGHITGTVILPVRKF